MRYPFNSNTPQRGSEEEVTTSRIDMSGNRIRYIVEYEMPGSEAFCMFRMLQHKSKSKSKYLILNFKVPII